MGRGCYKQGEQAQLALGCVGPRVNIAGNNQKARIVFDGKNGAAGSSGTTEYPTVQKTTGRYLNRAFI